MSGQKLDRQFLAEELNVAEDKSSSNVYVDMLLISVLIFKSCYSMTCLYISQIPLKCWYHQCRYFSLKSNH